jgi:glycosyltransferase involved in cell wall biosynthesis
MRVLFVTPYPVSRIRIRSYGFVSQLARQHELSVLALCAGDKDEADMQDLRRQGIAIAGIQEKRTRKVLRCLCALGQRIPLQVAYDAAPALRAAILEQLAARRFDILHVEFIRALGVLPDSLPLPVIWDAVDCISQLYEQGAHFGATPLLRLLGAREAQRTRAFELTQLQRFRHILVTSARDRQALLALAGQSRPVVDKQTLAEITVLPHGVDQQYFSAYNGQREAETLVFTGKMSFHANIAGALTLVKEILPRIWQQRPAVRLLIAGSNPPEAVRRLARDPRVRVTGSVPDLRPYLAQAQVAVSPLPYAVGIQNKILEAMASGTPVVASPSAGAGLEAVAGRDLLLARDPAEFAAAVLRVLDDHVLRGELRENGLAYIARHHTWQRIVAQLTAVYDRAIEDCTPHGLCAHGGQDTGCRCT